MPNRPESIKEQWRLINVASIMTHPVHVIFENSDLSTVEQAFLDYKIRHLPVVDEDDRIVGVISQRDLYRTIAPIKNDHGPAGLSIDALIEDQQFYYEKQCLHDFVLSRVMHKDPEVLFPEDTLAEALRVFVDYKIGCIPIVNQRREAVGILTRHDILVFFQAILSEVPHPEN